MQYFDKSKKLLFLCGKSMEPFNSLEELLRDERERFGQFLVSQKPDENTQHAA